MSASHERMAEELCGKWMPRKKTTCARTPGHGGDCMTAENMANRRECYPPLMVGAGVPLVVSAGGDD